MGGLAALLRLQDDYSAATGAQSKTPVERTQVSERALRNADTKITEEGLPGHRRFIRI